MAVKTIKIKEINYKTEGLKRAKYKGFTKFDKWGKC
jgi:hypothetical protein